jgi:hypothetical protein
MDGGQWQYQPLGRGKLEMERYKKPANWNWKQVFDGTKIDFVEERNGKVVFRRHGKASHTSMIKIGFYASERAANDPKSGPNVDMATTLLLNELAATGQLKWILYSIVNFDVQLEALKQYPAVYERLVAAKGRKGRTLLYVQVMEHYFRQTSLMFWLQTQKMGDREWKGALFQLMLTLAKIQEAWPLFRHNRYDPESIEIYVVNRGKVVKAELDGTKFEIEDPGFEIRVSDFQCSVIPGYIDNEDIATPLREEDPLYDQQTLARWILKNGDAKGDAGRFLHELIETRLTPREILLTNRYFDDIRQVKNKSPSKYKDMSSASESSLTELGSETNSAQPAGLARNTKVVDAIGGSGSRPIFNRNRLEIVRGARPSNRYLATESTPVFGGGKKKKGKQQSSSSSDSSDDDDDEDDDHVDIDDDDDDEDDHISDEDEDEDETDSESSISSATPQPSKKDRKKKKKKERVEKNEQKKKEQKKSKKQRDASSSSHTKSYYKRELARMKSDQGMSSYMMQQPTTGTSGMSSLARALGAAPGMSQGMPGYGPDMIDPQAHIQSQIQAQMMGQGMQMPQQMMPPQQMDMMQPQMAYPQGQQMMDQQGMPMGMPMGGQPGMPQQPMQISPEFMTSAMQQYGNMTGMTPGGGVPMMGPQMGGRRPYAAQNGGGARPGFFF